MTNEEREFIIEKKEKFEDLSDRNFFNARMLCIAGISMGLISAVSTHGINILPDLYSQGLFAGAGFASAIASCISAVNGFRYKIHTSDYDMLLNGLENEQNQELEKEVKSI